MLRYARFFFLSLFLAAFISCTPQKATPPAATQTPLAGPTVSPQNATELAQALLQALLKEDWAAAEKDFDARMKGGLPPAKLGDVWKGILAQSGAYKGQLGTRMEKWESYDIVVLTLQFEKVALDMRVTVDPKTGLISGLYFVPSQGAATPPPAADYVPPAYADLNAFQEQEVTVGEEEWELPGTLTMPKGPGPFPGVVLVHGSGPNDRDETIGANKPFRDIAWGLASRGIAVLRYDKRTKVHSDKLAAIMDRFTVQQETIDDALDAVMLLRKAGGVDPAKVFVLGHSLGGMLAPWIGAVDTKLAGLLILAGPTRPLEDLILEQSRYILGLDGELSADDKQNLEELEKQVTAVKNLKPADRKGEPLLGAPPIYWLDLRGYRPAEMAKTISQPLLILQGERDYQVTMTDFQGWKDALSAQSGVQLKSYPDLNHLFVAGQGKSSPQEYGKPGHVAEVVISDIVAWIQER